MYQVYTVMKNKKQPTTFHVFSKQVLESLDIEIFGLSLFIWLCLQF
jgi:hypothetical protein